MKDNQKKAWLFLAPAIICVTVFSIWPILRAFTMSIKLMKDLQFAEKLNSTNAISEAGKELLNNYRAYVYSNAPTCAVVNAFVNEAQKYSFDAGVSTILESVKNFINENKISWKLATACESINNNNSTFNYINKIGVQQVEKLLEMNENDVVSYIKAGSLKSFQYIPEFRQICKEVYKQNITETKAPNFTVSNPLSFVLVNEDSQYINVLGKTFKIADNKIEEASCDDKTFNEINKLLELKIVFTLKLFTPVKILSLATRKHPVTTAFFTNFSPSFSTPPNIEKIKSLMSLK